MTKNTTENASATARNAGVAAGGAARTELGVLAVNIDVSVEWNGNEYIKSCKVLTVSGGNGGGNALKWGSIIGLCA